MGRWATLPTSSLILPETPTSRTPTVPLFFEWHPDGSATVSTGTGIPASSGDGAPAVLASLQAPRHLALDRAGNLYIATLRPTAAVLPLAARTSPFADVPGSRVAAVIGSVRRHYVFPAVNLVEVT